MQTTNISWADYTWNPVTGCSHAGPECWNCYAESFSLRQGRTESEWTQENASENVTMHRVRLEEDLDGYTFPEGPGRVFVGSMTDMFHREVDPEFVQEVLDRVREHPQHVWIFLTKRPHHASEWRLGWPENVWLGTSVGSGPGGKFPSTTHRIEQLRDVDVATKWVSFEPLIEPIGEVALDHIDWAVVGGESGAADDRREMDHAWAREILEQCREQDVAFYFKQSSGPRPEIGTRLTVKNDDWGVYEQRRIREFPPLPDVTKRARGDESNR
ncbi:phage Gp37/Gp68 family protein [Halosolutus halophilus]|uniref:phage Gp37/Gp68 family protein n=1 Tax=Halosolutus halophilus TaxID=1552990 RepID=UPI002235156B|nr:phage Gp37/Gp68 family protein [Halosolutus halophilus]